jgi:LisH domain-containing protein ARMC9
MIASDFQTKKLEFYLHVYFVIYVFHPHNNQGARERSLESLKVEQAEFKKYLDNAGSDLSKTSEFLAFYALPYVPNPTDHPSFKSLFSMDWVNQLKSQLKGFVHERAFELGLPHLGQNSS